MSFYAAPICAVATLRRENLLKIKKYLTVLLAIFFSLSLYSEENPNLVDFIIFSYNRPLQLYALLESIEKYMTGVGDIRVIYRSDNNRYENAYKTVKKRFSPVIFLKQGANPKKDFKTLTMKTLKASPHEYILFAVDDMIVTDFVDLSYTASILKKHKAYGFYLRLGKNITFHYIRNKKEKLPPLKHVIDDIFSWKFTHGQYYWRYPNTVDMTIYKKRNITKTFKSLNFYNPNSLESAWQKQKGQVIDQQALCYKYSKVINIPVNRVQNTSRNKHMHSFTPKQLLDFFNQGLKIDLQPLFKIKNKSAHIAHNITFTEREL